MVAVGWEPAGASTRRSRYGGTGMDVRLLVVRCGPYRLGFPTGLVRGVVAAGEIVPLGLPELEGLMWREGALIPATRLSPLLGLEDGGSGVSGHGVLVHSSRGLICLLVDEAVDLIEAPDSSIQPLPPLVERAVALSGLESAAVLDSLLLVLDPVQLLGSDGIATLVAAAARMAQPTSEGEEE